MSEATLKTISKTISRFRGKIREKANPITGILVYHGISQTPQKNCVLVDSFVTHLEYLKSNYTLIRLSEMVDRISDDPYRLSDLVSITFDDAYDNFFTLAYPEIVKRKIPVTLFVPAALTDQYNHWDYDNNQKAYPYLKIMTFDALRELNTEYVEIGSHTSNHKRLSAISDEDIRFEISESKKILEKELDRTIDLFAYPYGALTDFDDRAVENLKACDYKAAVSTHFGRFNSSADLFRLNRISVWDDDTRKDLEEKLTGNYDWLTLKEKFAFAVKKKLLAKIIPSS